MLKTLYRRGPTRPCSRPLRARDPRYFDSLCGASAAAEAQNVRRQASSTVVNECLHYYRMTAHGSPKLKILDRYGTLSPTRNATFVPSVRAIHAKPRLLFQTTYTATNTARRGVPVSWEQTRQTHVRLDRKPDSLYRLQP